MLQQIKSFFCRLFHIGQHERWKIIPDTNGEYECSTLGRFRSIERYVNGKSGNTTFKKIIKAKILKTTIDEKKKSCTFRIRINGKKTGYSVPRIIALTFIPKPPGMNYVIHKSRNWKNNRVDNLKWTYSRDATNYKINYNPKLRPRLKGCDNPMSKLNPSDVLGIRQMGNDKTISYYSIAKLFKTSQNTVSRIINKKSYLNI